MNSVRLMYNGSDNNTGFTIVEVLIAVMLFSIGMIALASLAGTAMKATEGGKRRTQALNIATQGMESLKSINIDLIQSTDAAANVPRACALQGNAPPTFLCTPTNSPVVLDNMNYNWTWTVTYLDLDNDGVVYSAGTIIDSDDIKRIDLIVSWTDLLGSHNITLTTLRGI